VSGDRNQQLRNQQLTSEVRELAYTDYPNPVAARTVLTRWAGGSPNSRSRRAGRPADRRVCPIRSAAICRLCSRDNSPCRTRDARAHPDGCRDRERWTVDSLRGRKLASVAPDLPPRLEATGRMVPRFVPNLTTGLSHTVDMLPVIRGEDDGLHRAHCTLLMTSSQASGRTRPLCRRSFTCRRPRSPQRS
jgi:hypothetical protein